MMGKSSGLACCGLSCTFGASPRSFATRRWRSASCLAFVDSKVRAGADADADAVGASAACDGSALADNAPAIDQGSRREGRMPAYRPAARDLDPRAGGRNERHRGGSLVRHCVFVVTDPSQTGEAEG